MATISACVLHPGLMQSPGRRSVSGVTVLGQASFFFRKPFFSLHISPLTLSISLSLPCRVTKVSFYGLKVTRSSMRSNLNLIHSITVGDYRMGRGGRNTGLTSLAALSLSFSFSHCPCRPRIKPWLCQKWHVQSLVPHLHKLFIAVP